MRLNAYLARAGVTSRRGADNLIEAGQVQVNGLVAQFNTYVNDGDIVLVEGNPVTTQKLRYIVLNKPPATVTTLSDPEGRKTVIDLVNIPERAVPAGRLDYDTTGALLITNDGQLAHKLMHPSFEVEKVYVAEVSGVITPDILNKLSIGVKLEDGITAPAKARKIGHNKIELAIHEGRNHQVKRMLEAVGVPVKFLHRSRYAGLSVDGMELGKWRELTKEEIYNLKMIQ